MLEPDIMAQLRKIMGKDAVLTSKEDLTTYSYDGTATWAHMPDVVVLPTTAEQVSQVLKLANENKVPVTPRGAGTNVSGGSIPIKGGIVLCTVKMNKILDINKTNFTATVEPGIVLQDFNMALAKQGLFYPPDPQSFLGCTVGGTIAENAGGPYCVKYGVTKQYVLGLEVVLANGYIMKLGGVTVKNRTGYELMMLFTGSEGTLGVITKITLRLIPMPQASQTMMAVFDDMTAGGQAVSNILASGVIPAKIEFVDNFILRRIEEMMSMGLPTEAQALLLIMSDGSPAAVEAETKQIVDTLEKSGAREVKVAKDADEAAKYWKMRSAGFAATFGAAKTVLAEDVAVPLLYYKDAVRATMKLYDAPEEQIKTVCYNLAGISPTPTAGQLEKTIKKFLPDADISYEPDPMVMEYYRTRPVSTIDDTRAREELGWQPEFTDIEKVVADFIEEVRARPDFWSVGVDDRRQ